MGDEGLTKRTRLRQASLRDRRYGQNVSDATRTPLTIESAWQSKTVTTNAPIYTPHLEWALAFTLTAAEALRLVVLIEAPYGVSWGLVARGPTTGVKATATFAPYAWASSDDVQVRFEWQRAGVTDPQLKEDPRQVVNVVAPRRTETASRIPVAALPSHGLTLAVIALAERDTERRREGRWRLKPALAEAVDWWGSAVLASGHQSGRVTAPPAS